MANASQEKVIRIGGATASFSDTALSVPQLLAGGQLDGGVGRQGRDRMRRRPRAQPLAAAYLVDGGVADHAAVGEVQLQ